MSQRRRGVPAAAVIVIAIAALAIGSIGGFVVGLTGSAVSAAAGQATPAVATSAGAVDSSPPSTQPSAAFAYTADMFQISLKTVSKQCFGSAGCNVTVVPVLAADAASIPDTANGSLTYEIDGDDSGPVTVTTDLTGSQYSQRQSDLSTSSSTKKLTVKIVDIQTN